MREQAGNDDVATVPQLCIALNCLPSQIRKEDYNDIENIIAAFNAQDKLQKLKERKAKRR